MKLFKSTLFVILILFFVSCLIAGEIQVPITSASLIESPDPGTGMKNFLIMGVLLHVLEFSKCSQFS